MNVIPTQPGLCNLASSQAVRRGAERWGRFCRADNVLALLRDGQRLGRLPVCLYSTPDFEGDIMNGVVIHTLKFWKTQ